MPGTLVDLLSMIFFRRFLKILPQFYNQLSLFSERVSIHFHQSRP